MKCYFIFLALNLSTLCKKRIKHEGHKVIHKGTLRSKQIHLFFFDNTGNDLSLKNRKNIHQETAENT
jgi:hypothetical protein